MDNLPPCFDGTANLESMVFVSAGTVADLEVTVKVLSRQVAHLEDSLKVLAMVKEFLVGLPATTGTRTEAARIAIQLVALEKKLGRTL